MILEKQSYYEKLITLTGEQSEKQRNGIQSPKPEWFTKTNKQNKACSSVACSLGLGSWPLSPCGTSIPGPVVQWPALEDGHQALRVWASGFFPEGSQQRGGKKRASYSSPSGCFQNCLMEELAVLTCVMNAKNSQLRKENAKSSFYRDNSIPNIREWLLE